MIIKKILVPTDFSDAANNALNYATEIAEHFGAEIEILHAFSIPVLTARGKPFLPNPEVAEENRHLAEEHLEELKKTVSAKHNIKFNLLAIPIYWQLELAEVINDRQADLIVLGTTGASGLKKIFMGSNAARVIQNSAVPVLAIPENAKLAQLTKIGFAYDGLPLKELEKLSVINSFSKLFKAGIHVFQIVNDKLSPSVNPSEVLHYLSDPSYTEIDENEVKAGILKRIDSHELDLLVMIPRQRGFFHNLITGSITERVAYEISVPLLAIPE